MGQHIALDCFSTPKNKEHHTNLLLSQTGQTNTNSKKRLSLKQELIQTKKKCNELETQNNELIQQINQLMSYHKLKTSHHSWDYIKICKWITELEDGIFIPYKDILLKNFQIEDISGKDLCQLDINDLHRLGITSKLHKRILLSHIKTLTQFDKTPSYAQHCDTYLPNLIKTPISSFRQISRVSTNISQIDFSDIKMENSSSDPPNSNDLSKNNNPYQLTPTDKWSYNNGVIFIKVITANDISFIEGRKYNLYVGLELLGDYHQKEMITKINNNMNDISWNETFQFSSDNPRNDILNIKIYNKRKWKIDETIGKVCIPVMDVLNCDGVIDKEYDIKKSKYGGTLHIELKYKEFLN